MFSSVTYSFRTSIVDDEVTVEYNAVPEEKKAAVKDTRLTRCGNNDSMQHTVG